MSERIRILWSLDTSNAFSIPMPNDYEEWTERDRQEFISQKIMDEISEQALNFEIKDRDLRWTTSIEKFKDA